MDVMKVLWIFAHPEPRSLNAALRDAALRELEALGHEYRQSDLYAMDWDPVVSAADFTSRPEGRLFVGDAQEDAVHGGTLSEDIRGEQEKLAWADVIVMQFPLWWLGPPAILKGWFDRVLAQGFAFGLKGDDGRALRYGSGGLEGKRGLIITSAGARESSFGPRGIHGHIDQVLFLLQHGTYFYTGVAPLAPHVVYGADRLTDEGFAQEVDSLRARLKLLADEEPILFRPESGDDYDQDLVLRPHLAEERIDLEIHREGLALPPR